MAITLKRVWGGTLELLRRPPRVDWVGLLMAAGVIGFFFGLLSLTREWTQAQRAVVAIDLSPWALPRYAFYSLMRGLLAYGLSLSFTLVYGYWAAKDHVAEKVLVPLLDILQSIPVLGFMPGLVLALVSLFPASNIGLELAAILMIFTGQAWNMTFSFYHSVRSVPKDQHEVARVYRFSWWQNFKWMELPYSMMGLVWNSMMSMAGGWFFLMVSEAFVLGKQDFRLPGVGSYMSVAVATGNTEAMLWAVVAVVAMILVLDQLMWRPLVVWAQKFRVEDSSRQEVMSSWFLDWLRRSGISGWFGRLRGRFKREAALRKEEPAQNNRAARAISLLVFALLLAGLVLGGLKLIHFMLQVPRAEWPRIFGAASLTLGRVLLSTALGTVWAVPVGLAIGLSPRLSRILQPVVQVLASFPAPMLFPLVIAGLHTLSVPLGWGSIALMLLGTQWYILFNVIAGALFIPADLKEASESYRMNLSERFRWVYLPAIFPYLVTGWVTAAGGAWNASIVAEYVTSKGTVLTTTGLGAQISLAAERADFPVLTASVAVMSVVVVLFNRSVWRQCYRLAERRFSL